MKLQKKGDLLERKYFDLIQEKIPAYIDIWEKYIGNDGSENLIEQRHLGQVDKEKRKNFSEYHYTCLESLVCMSEIAKNNFEVNSMDTYLNTLNFSIAFQAQAGRLRDNVKKMLELFNMDKLIEQLEDTYQRRNTVLHGKKLPFKIDSGFMVLPIIKGKEEENNKWHEKMNWGDISSTETQFLNNFINESFEEICHVFNKILNNLKTPIFNFIRENEINISSFDNSEESGEKVFGVSGFSGSIHLN